MWCLDSSWRWGAGAHALHARGLMPQDGFTPLHCAVLKNHVDVVRLLLDNGANTEAVNKVGRARGAAAGSDGSDMQKGFRVWCLLALMPQSCTATVHGCAIRPTNPAGRVDAALLQRCADVQH